MLDLTMIRRWSAIISIALLFQPPVHLTADPSRDYGKYPPAEPGVL